MFCLYGISLLMVPIYPHKLPNGKLLETVNAYEQLHFFQPHTCSFTHMIAKASTECILHSFNNNLC